MKIKLLVLGKTSENYIITGITEYEKRIKKYISYEMQVIPDLKNTKNLSQTLIKEREAEQLLNTFNNDDYIILLDEQGKQFTSEAFAGFIQNKMIYNTKNLIFVIGGPYGFAPSIYNKAHEKISFSLFTFSHQIIRLIFMEQLYRAFTIIKGEPYHHS